VARGLPRQLSTEQLDIVLAHEQAHTRQGDNLSRWLMNTACSLWPSVMAQPLLNRYALVTEQLADALVVRSTSATDIASTLVRVARLHRESPVNSSVHSPAHSSAHWSAFLSEAEPKALQIRVNQLLSPTVESSWLAFALLMVFFGLSLASVSSLDFLHHGV
ncbi:MAG: M48 family metalloprotease, partial [Oceanobacter sp.]